MVGANPKDPPDGWCPRGARARALNASRPDQGPEHLAREPGAAAARQPIQPGRTAAPRRQQQRVSSWEPARAALQLSAGGRREPERQWQAQEQLAQGGTFLRRRRPTRPRPPTTRRRGAEAPGSCSACRPGAGIPGSHGQFRLAALGTGPRDLCATHMGSEGLAPSPVGSAGMRWSIRSAVVDSKRAGYWADPPCRVDAALQGPELTCSSTRPGRLARRGHAGYGPSDSGTRQPIAACRVGFWPGRCPP